MSPRLLSLLLVAGLSACRTFESTARQALDPVVVVHGAGGDELGVATDYGVVFLGRTAQAGRIEFTAWFGDGPSREEGLVEDVGGGLYTTESEILLPAVAIGFEPLPAGTPVIVRGRRDGQPFEIEAELASDTHVEGVLVRANTELDALGDESLGAGVFQLRPGKRQILVGLVSGRLQLEGGHRYVTAIGPEDLWRVVVHRRNSDRPRHRVYRDDIL